MQLYVNVHIFQDTEYTTDFPNAHVPIILFPLINWPLQCEHEPTDFPSCRGHPALSPIQPNHTRPPPPNLLKCLTTPSLSCAKHGKVTGPHTHCDVSCKWSGRNKWRQRGMSPAARPQTNRW
ncbi:hypothetical protein IQ06DRAFT_19878 [Phaeosphaeriaceae sp. SRC1lsM3a]|nr:hypothetical protein IQ06DRAFT_19878 [Stagonospora sp. SRC1lsM3a]